MHSSATRAPIAAALLALAGCPGATWVSLDGQPTASAADDTASESATSAPAAALVTMEDWVVASEPDPMEAHRPEVDGCTELGWGVEGESLEVDTGICAFLSLTQPLRVDLSVGEPVEWVFWHGWLTNPTPAEGHVAIYVGQELLVEQWIDIPGDPWSYTEVVPSSISAPAGTPVTLHLHNHGSNTWNVLRLERVGEP